MGIFGLWRDEEEIIESARSVEKEIRIGFYVASRAAWGAFGQSNALSLELEA